MKLAPDCYECLKRLIDQAANLATHSETLRARAIAEGRHILDEHFSPDCTSITIATKVHAAIKSITANPDPYRIMKDIEISVSWQLYEELKSIYNGSFLGLLKLAALGNAIDFFRPIDQIKADMRDDISFDVNMSKEFETRLRSAVKVLYLADNSGEVYFDLPLMRWMQQFSNVTYVVKSEPVQNDITVEEIEKAGLIEDFPDIGTTGTATPGVIFDQASDTFKQSYSNADIIFAKGMGYYESLSELPADGRIFYCLKAKCQPVADSLNVPLYSYVAMIQ